jgi:hypothetical protein
VIRLASNVHDCHLGQCLNLHLLMTMDMQGD